MNTLLVLGLFPSFLSMIAVPVTILFMVMQRFLVEGLTAGGEKG